MTDTARRPIPHICHTVALAHAASAVTNAGVGKTPGVWPTNVMDLQQVRGSLQGMGKWLDDPNFFFPDDSEVDGELKATENIILLATLLREHLKAGNT
jgi:hypothetical protein